MSGFSGVFDFLSGGNYGKAGAMGQSAVDAIANMPVYDPAKAQITLGRAVELGELTPEQAQNYLLQYSAMNGVQPDAATVQAQREALVYFQDVAKNGMTAADRAQLESTMIQENANERGNREAILQQMAQRGQLGSGAEIQSKLISQQGSANRNFAAGTNMAAAAQQRALQAMTQAGSYATSLRGQEVSEQTAKAQAADAIAQFNANMQAQTNRTNVAANNNAAAQNLAQQYAIQNTNLAQQRAEQDAAAASYVNGYNANANSARNASQAAFNAANMYNQAGNQQLQAITSAASIAAGANWGGASGAAGSSAAPAASSVAGYGGTGSGSGLTLGNNTGVSGGTYSWYSDERLKEDEKQMSDNEVEDLLNGLTGYSYHYKPEVGGQPGVGVMAQDLEKTALKDNVVDTPQGKMVVGDGQMMSAMLAALANINKRVNDIEGDK